MRKMACVLLIAISYCCGVPVLAGDFRNSAKSNISDNPFLAYGYDYKTGIVSGYLAAFRTAPGRTDECKLVFRGSVERLSVKYLEENWVAGRGNEGDSTVLMAIVKNEPYLKFYREAMGGDCEWILPFKVGKRVHASANEVFVKMNVSNSGNWIGVYAIGAKKASFHGQPDSGSVKTSYLVAGDVVYVYDEQSDWYFVHYDNGTRTTSGWIKKVDTVQP